MLRTGNKMKDKISTLENVSDKDRQALLVGCGVLGFFTGLIVFSLWLLIK